MAVNAKRFWIGFGWGLVGTLAMSALMLLGRATGLAPMREPIPLVVMKTIVGPDTAMPLLMALAIAAHFAYGATWGGILAATNRPVTLLKGLTLGVALWLVMQLVVLPMIGWGVFGLAAGRGIWLATLVLHLVYGGTVGLLVDRHPGRAPQPARRHAEAWR